MFARTRRDARFGCPQRRNGVIEFLSGGGPLCLQAGDAIVGRACEGEASFRGQELGCGSVRTLFGGKGRRARGTCAGGKIVAIEHDERLAFADPIAWRHADLAHRRQDARSDRGRVASLHHAARIDRSGHVGHRNLGNGDGDGLCRVGRSRGGRTTRASGQRRARQEGERNGRKNDVMTRGDLFMFMAFLSLVGESLLR